MASSAGSSEFEPGAAGLFAAIRVSGADGGGLSWPRAAKDGPPDRLQPQLVQRLHRQNPIEPSLESIDIARFLDPGSLPVAESSEAVLE